ncbi:hypothetical protein LA52FAK_09580 [Desulforhopalus sp. 52FAK]
MYSAMFGSNGISLPVAAEALMGSFAETMKMIGFTFEGALRTNVFGDVISGLVLLFVLLITVWALPNTLDLLRNENPALGVDSLLTKEKSLILWKPNKVFSLILIFISVVSILFLQEESEFLYFQF